MTRYDFHVYPGYRDLSPSLRAHALAEFARDRIAGLQYSPRLHAHRHDDYVTALETALREDPHHLRLVAAIAPLCAPTYLTQTGKTLKTPTNAAELIAQTEFKRYYIAGVCLSAIESGDNDVVYFRAFETISHRLESDYLEGTHVPASQILQQIREDVGPGTQPRPPMEFGSGLCVGLINASIST